MKRVALSGDFFDDTGAPVFPMFDLSPLRDRADVDLVVLDHADEISADQLRGVDALILLMPRITEASLAGNDRLALIARFGVGYDTVDVDACTRNHVALVVTPEVLSEGIRLRRAGRFRSLSACRNVIPSSTSTAARRSSAWR